MLPKQGMRRFIVLLLMIPIFIVDPLLFTTKQVMLILVRLRTAAAMTAARVRSHGHEEYCQWLLSVAWKEWEQDRLLQCIRIRRRARGEQG